MSSDTPARLRTCGQDSATDERAGYHHANADHWRLRRVEATRQADRHNNRVVLALRENLEEPVPQRALFPLVEVGQRRVGGPCPKRGGRRQDTPALVADQNLDYGTRAGQHLRQRSLQCRVVLDNPLPELLHFLHRYRRRFDGARLFIDAFRNLVLDHRRDCAGTLQRIVEVGYRRQPQAHHALGQNHQGHQRDDGDPELGLQRHKASMLRRAASMFSDSVVSLLLLSSFNCPCRLNAVLLQLIEKRLQADPQNLGRSRFVVFRMRERQQDERLFGLLDGSANRDVDAAVMIG